MLLLPTRSILPRRAKFCYQMHSQVLRVSLSSPSPGQDPARDGRPGSLYPSFPPCPGLGTDAPKPAQEWSAGCPQTAAVDLPCLVACTVSRTPPARPSTPAPQLRTTEPMPGLPAHGAPQSEAASRGRISTVQTHAHTNVQSPARRLPSATAGEL